MQMPVDSIRWLVLLDPHSERQKCLHESLLNPIHFGGLQNEDCEIAKLVNSGSGVDDKQRMV